MLATKILAMEKIVVTTKCGNKKIVAIENND
jgi:hypothetical protein